MNFKDAEQAYQQLKKRYEQGEISPEIFESSVNEQIKVQDRFGRTWQLGVSSGKWYCFENGQWKHAVPQPDLLAESSSSSEMPEALWKKPEPKPIFFNQQVAAENPAPDSEPLKSPPPSAPAAPENRSSTAEKLKDGLSWFVLASILIGLIAVIFFMGSLITREFQFGWNPQTPARIGSPTPSPAKTSTPLPNTQTPTPTRLPTTLPTPQPSPNLTPAAQYIPINWQPLETNTFESPNNLQGMWSRLARFPLDTTFNTYQELNSMQVQYSQDTTLFAQDANGQVIEDQADAMLEVILAFPEANSENALKILCRTPDGSDGYSLRITRRNWQLLKSIAGEETILAEGPAPQPLQSGAWGTMRLACSGNQLLVWDAVDQLAAVEDNSFAAGKIALLFEKETSAAAGSLRLYYERILTVVE